MELRSFWNAAGSGTREAQMERRRLWNARSANGTPQALERAKR